MTKPTYGQVKPTVVALKRKVVYSYRDDEEMDAESLSGRMEGKRFCIDE